jgi:large subunit ribosomal protein L16
MSTLLPAKTKYRKAHKGRLRGRANKGNTLAFGDFALQSLEASRITGAQLEAARVAINRHLKRKGKLWTRVFPHKPVTKKPAETRMGKGKGPVEYWIAVVKPGTILFEVSGVSATAAREAMSLANAKLSCYCRFLNREELEKF